MPGRPGGRARAVLAGALTAVAVASAVTVGSGPGPASAPVVQAAGQTTDPAAACQDRRGGWLVACPHGNDTPPPGVSLFHRPTLAELEERTTLRSPSPRLRGLAALEQATTAASASGQAAVPCIGDGASGNRVQVIYARPPDAPDRYPSLLPSFRQWAGELDRAVWLSAGETGGGRHLRFVTDGACQLQVAQVILSPLGDDSFAQMRTELQVAGYNRSDRKYLVWVDAAVGICGLGEVYDDQRPVSGNSNNAGPMYARVDAPCWHYAELHEIFHTLGAVQPDTPHHSAARHCTDEADVMCYDDDASGPVTMTVVCPPEHEALLDCGHDDYFSTSPPAGSYLASHWNTAASSFLEPASAARPARLSLAGAATITYGSRASLSGRLTDQSGAGIGGGQVILWAQPATTSGWQQAATATTGADGLFRFTAAPAATTAYRASFAGSDTYGTANSAPVAVSVRAKVMARKSASAIRYDQTVTVTGTVSPNHAGQRVYLQRRVSGAWKTAATATLSSSSGYSLRAKPRAKGKLTYRVYKSADRDHVASASANQAVTVS
jgi:hypothetical protein